MARQNDETLNFYRTLRDRFEPGKPIWLTERPTRRAVETGRTQPFWIRSDTSISLAGSQRPA